MSGFKREELHRFVKMREKSPPPVFVGRKSILNSIFEIANTTGEEGIGIPGNTTVIQGAPGAGKSSVLHHLEAQNANDKAPKALYVSSVELEELFSDVLMAIATLGYTDRSKLKRLALQTTKSVGSLALLDVIGQISISLKELQGLFKTHDIQNVMSLHKAFPAEEWDTPVIVAIDEAQNFPKKKGTQQSGFLMALHEARTKLPLTLVVAGLGDTHSVIRSMGLTHGVKAHSLGCFNSVELTELTEKWCVHFGIEIGSCQEKMDLLMANTDGWPRHVHWAQRALAEAVLMDGVDGFADRIPNWNAIQSKADTLRRGYYDSQYSDVIDESSKLAGRVMLEIAKREQMGLFFKKDEIVGLVEKFSEENNEPGWRIPKTKDSVSYVTELIHCGALQSQSMDTYDRIVTCPIPSFQSYIIKQGGFDLPVDSDTPSPYSIEDPYRAPNF
ncbi:MAG: hypothetical protein OXC62_11030 [Aestuariivita sp.]|nr:hypothetical protein [Aestuariivita sp.]